MPASCLYAGEVMHRRLRPFGHRFVYSVFSIMVDIDELPELGRRLRLFAHNGRGVFSLRDRDHGPRDNVVATGGGPGIMEAANRGAHEAGAPSIGFNITLPHEQEPNPYSTPDLTFRFHYFAMRKMHLAMRANALVVFPGGFGTMDELFELLTLQQTGKAPGMPVVLFDRGFWSRAIDFGMLVEQGMVASADLSLFEMVDTAEEAWESLRRRGLRIGTGT